MAIELTPVQGRDTVDINFGKVRKDESAQGIKLGSADEAIKTARSALELEEKARIKAAENGRNTFKARLKNNLSNVMSKAQNDVSMTMGEDSFVATEKAQAKMKQDMDEIIALTPDEYKEDAKAFADAELRQFNLFATGYQMREYKKVQDDTFKMRQENIIEQAVLASASPLAFEKSLLEINENTAQYVQATKGGLLDEPSDEVKAYTEAAQLKARSGAVLKAVESFVSIGDSDMANLYNNKFKETITASDQIKINKLLQEGAEKNEDNVAKLYFDRILRDANNDRMVANSMARQMAGADGKVYSKVNSMLVSYFNTFDENERIDLEKKSGEAYKNILSGKYVNPLNYDGRIADKINEYNQKKADGRYNVTDAKTYSKLFNTFLFDPQTFGDPQKTNIDSYFNKLSAERMAELKALQKSVMDPLTSKFSRSSVNGTIDAHIKRIAAQRGVNYKENPKAYTQIEAAVKAMAGQALVNTAAKLGDRASVMEFERTFNNEMSFKLSKTPTVKQGLTVGNVFKAVTSPFRGENPLDAIADLMESTEEQVPRPPDKDYLDQTRYKESSLVDPNNPEYRKALGILQDKARNDVKQGKLSQYKEPTNEQVLDLMNRARKNMNIKKTTRK